MKKNGTTAVIKVQNKLTGEVKTLVATEGKTMPTEFVGALRRGEEFIGEIGHAEQTILKNLGPNWTPIEGGLLAMFARNSASLSSRGMG